MFKDILSVIIIVLFFWGFSYLFLSANNIVFFSNKVVPKQTSQTLISASLGQKIPLPPAPSHITTNLFTTTAPPHPLATAFPKKPSETPSINPRRLSIIQTTPYKTTNTLSFIKQTPIIAGQQTYIALPTNLDPTKPPALIIYNHGSSLIVSTNFRDPFMTKLQDYGAYFTAQGYIFAASNQHGDNWGNQVAINDTNYLITWIKSHYIIQNKVHLIGHSMGGTTALYYALRNPNQVKSIALLAPSINVVAWKSAHFAILQNIPIAIWHGYQDNNVSWKVSQQFVDVRKSKGQRTSLILLSGLNHWTIEGQQVRKEILNFFLSF